MREEAGYHIHILCLLGRAGVGKTTVAKYLKQIYGAEIVSLAAPLKRVAKAVMSFSDEQLYGPQHIKEAIDPRYGMSARQFLQLLGTDGLREYYGKDVHVKNLLRKLDTFGSSRVVYVVDDVRFPDEAEVLGSTTGRIAGAVIKLVCTDAPRPQVEHMSEASIDLVADDHIAATVASSRAQGTRHLCAQVEHVLSTEPRLQSFRQLLGQIPTEELSRAST